ncbi:MAG: acyl-CoA dehydrogenase family protein [Oceanicaulis sp.]|uniref:acyl-CoA dehydrogenase family protein n=1 Tax=Glycocaulis sp. TaxID=1969725 RepID=UPI0025B7C93C|nr:acyl-CoA dehydrogenase family protein [Glycocaulis sp.]MCC5980731.1 acyl-CoA dehydrogenase family protein [Oceanicaulis sp.]MCH8521082.1 acyl-CoA dehydrogenase family protein [Glycocaulis sp.]
MSLETFRTETRAWLEANCPPAMRVPAKGEADICWGGKNWTFASDDQRIWLERMVERGWTVPTWPKEYGGGGLSKEEAFILKEEMKAIRARSPLDSFGIWMLGPALLKYGNEEQKREHLPKIARGEIRWCQGYSEPGAGSDLASLRTKGVKDGDEYIINGQKVWTSYADKSDWIFALVRTEADAPKHLGISFILIDMDTPGVSTKPIKLISGKSPFCETFFDDARAPVANVVGKPGQGWEIAKYLLSHERAGIVSDTVAGGLNPVTASHQVGEVDEHGRIADPILRGDVARLTIDALAFEATMRRVKDEADHGEGVGARASILKYVGTELNKRRHELNMSALGSDGLLWEGEKEEDGDPARNWLRSRANSIEGGTSEIQLNIVAKRVLELPGT